MRKPTLKPIIWKKLRENTKGQMTEKSIRSTLSKIREAYPFLTINAAAEIFAKKKGFSVVMHLDDKDRETMKNLEVKTVEILLPRHRREKEIIELATYETDNVWLGKHIDEINRAFTCGCYTATFVLCRKVLENLVIYHILKKKYPDNKKEHKEKYYDFARGRFLDFEKLLTNLRNSSSDFGSEKKLAERICGLAEAFKESANEMTHSLYHIATRKEIEDKRVQEILDLIATLEKSLP